MPRFQSPLSTISQSSHWMDPPWYLTRPLWRKMPISRAFTRPGRQAPYWIPQWGPHGEWCPSPEPPSPCPSRPSRRSPPNRAPTKRDASSPSKYLLIFPVNGLPRFPNGPLQRETPISRAFFYTFPSKSPVNETPPCSPTRSPWREKLHLQSQWFIHSLKSVRVPNKESFHEKLGKHLEFLYCPHLMTNTSEIHYGWPPRNVTELLLIS
jgi:hypothetical protein